jgi:hypothetical protein
MPRGGSPLRVTGPSPRRSGTKHPTTKGSPCGPDGTPRPSPRPHDATEQKTCYRDKNKRHLLKTLRLINRSLRLLCLSETPPGSGHGTRSAEATP